MKYYLGIDGGGTKTKVIVINELKEVVFENIVGPSSVDTVSLDETLKAFKDSIKDLDKKITFEACFAGLGGIIFDKDKENVEEQLKKLPGVTNKTVVKAENDMHNALYSGLLFDEGIALIAGTGMVAFGKDLYGNVAKCGGWGYKEGDLGSAYSMGKRALRYMIRAFDGRYEIDDFAQEIADKVGLKDAKDIVKIMDELYLKRTDVADLSRIVNKYANVNNKYASVIVNNMTDELALAVSGVLKQTNIKNKKLVVVGSLGNLDGLFKTLLHKKIKELDQNIEILAPLVDPALAAALMAQNLTK